MIEIQISIFEAQCLSLLDRVNRTREELTATRHEKPLVIINSVQNIKPRKGCGTAKETIEIKKDIVESATDISDWQAFG